MRKHVNRILLVLGVAVLCVIGLMNYVATSDISSANTTQVRANAMIVAVSNIGRPFTSEAEYLNAYLLTKQATYYTNYARFAQLVPGREATLGTSLLNRSMVPALSQLDQSLQAWELAAHAETVKVDPQTVATALVARNHFRSAANRLRQQAEALLSQSIRGNAGVVTLAFWLRAISILFVLLIVANFLIEILTGLSDHVVNRR